jgi:hypothetical protein
MAGKVLVSLVCIGVAALSAVPARAAAPPKPAGAGAGHWELIDTKTAEAFAADPRFPPVRSQTTLAEGGSRLQSGAVSGDRGAGAAGARAASAGQAFSLSGSGGAKASGGGRLDLSELWDAAAGGPDLQDGSGRKAWKLSLAGDAMRFTPYDRDGNLRAGSGVLLERGKSAAGGTGGAVEIATFKAGTLSGRFVNKVQGTESATLKIQ